MSTFTEAASALRKAATDLQAATKRSVVEATALVEAAVRAGRGRAGASSGRLHGVGKGGAPIGERGTVRGNTGLVRATGPAHLLDHPTKPHLIAARPGSVLATPYGPRQSVNHPGTKGKPYFEEAVAATTPQVEQIFERNMIDALARELG